jgi:putative addiction module component (TIGR02574 family)
MVRPNIDINRLSRDERLDLIEELWDSLGPSQTELPLTEAQRNELDRRLDEMDADNTLGIPWDQVLKQIREHG